MAINKASGVCPTTASFIMATYLVGKNGPKRSPLQLLEPIRKLAKVLASKPNQYTIPLPKFVLINIWPATANWIN